MMKGERDFNTWQKQFNLFPDDKGLIRCRGRLENATLPYSKRPLLLPRKAHFTILIVRNAHSRAFHNGVASSIAQVTPLVLCNIPVVFSENE